MPSGGVTGVNVTVPVATTLPGTGFSGMSFGSSADDSTCFGVFVSLILSTVHAPDCLFLLRMRFCDSCVPVRPVATSAYRTYAPPFVFRRGNPLVLRLRPSIGSSLSTDLSIVNRIAVTVSSVGKPMSFLSPVESPFRPQSARLVTHPNLFVPAVMTASHQFTLFHVLNCFLNYFLRWPWLPNWKRP